MSFYDRIAKRWHRITGYRGGAFKELLLNDVLLGRMPRIDKLAILELGAGNGYFLPLALRHFSGQQPSFVAITDGSQELLSLACRHFHVEGAEYRLLDIRGPFPYADGRFNLILATMVLNELPARYLAACTCECHRVLADAGRFLATVVHPEFVRGLRRRGALVRVGHGPLTMPGSGSLRVPVTLTSRETYRRALATAKFEFVEEEIFGSDQLLSVKPGLRHLGRRPLALVFDCQKAAARSGVEHGG